MKALFLLLLASACWLGNPSSIPSFPATGSPFRSDGHSTAQSEEQHEENPLQLIGRYVDLREVATNLVRQVSSVAVLYAASYLFVRTLQNVASEYALGRSARNLGWMHSILPNATLDEYEEELAHRLVSPLNITEKWEQIGGMGLMKLQLLDLVDYRSAKHWESKKSNATQPLLDDVRSILLFGPPGCGKTFLVRAFCKKLGLPLLTITPSTLLRKYVGDTSLMTRAVFSLAKKCRPVVLFVDEVDSLFRSRREEDDTVGRHLATEFMQLWDELSSSNADVLILAATNRPHDLDPAVQRRFDRSFLLSYPDCESRVDILRTVLTSHRVDNTVDISLCAQRTEGYTGNDLSRLCSAAIRAVRKKRRPGQRRGGGLSTRGTSVRLLTTNDMLAALRTILPTSWMAKSYASMAHRAGEPPSPDAEVDLSSFVDPSQGLEAQWPEDGHSTEDIDAKGAENEEDEENEDDGDDEEDEEDREGKGL